LETLTFLGYKTNLADINRLEVYAA